MTNTNRLSTIAFAATLFGAVACSDSTGSGTGTVGVRLTNTSVAASVAASLVDGEVPLPPGSIKSVNLFVVRIDARHAEASDEEAAANTEESEAAEGGWVTLAEPNAVIDLMTIADGSTAFLGEAEVAAGGYSGFRLVIDPAKSSVTLNDEASTVIGGESIVGLKFPSAAQTGIKVKLSGPVEVEEGEETTVLVKFDVSQSFVMRGSTIEQNGLLFTPVIKAEQQELPE
jgi:hypothetical protein